MAQIPNVEGITMNEENNFTPCATQVRRAISTRQDRWSSKTNVPELVYDINDGFPKKSVVFFSVSEFLAIFAGEYWLIVARRLLLSKENLSGGAGIKSRLSESRRELVLIMLNESDLCNFSGNINKRLLLFGKLYESTKFTKEYQSERISCKRLCVKHGRDLSGLMGFGRASKA